MNKIRLTEDDIHRLVKETLIRVLQENDENEGARWNFMKGAVRKVGKDISTGLNAAYEQGKNKARNAKNAVTNYVDNIKSAGQRAANVADAQQGLKTIQDLINKGILNREVGQNTINSLYQYINQ